MSNTSEIANPLKQLIIRRPGAEVRDPGPHERVVTLGWAPDLPDMRDYGVGHEKIKAAVESLKATAAQRGAMLAGEAELPTRVDLRGGFSRVENQYQLGSCTAQAVVGVIEYLIRQAGGSAELSRLFLYKVTRKLMGWTGDTGAFIRSTIKAAAAFGVPPERYWPYVTRRFEEEPSAFLYAFAREYQALEYFRLDLPSTGGEETLELLKQCLAAELPVAFGFTVYSSLGNEADIPFPSPGDTVEGGHAIVAVGYDDDHLNAAGEREPSLIIRNSWGTDWGEWGYGYMPYRYVTDGYAEDFWAILNQEWFDGSVFR